MKQSRRLPLIFVGTLLILANLGCSDTKVKVRLNSLFRSQTLATGPNPINTNSVGAFAGKTVGNNYTVQIKLGAVPLSSTLTNNGSGSYRVYSKVVVQ